MFHVKHLPLAAAPRPRVRIVLPSGALRTSDMPAFEDGFNRLTAGGFDVRFDPRRADDRWRAYYAGDDQARARELIDALCEPDIDIVWWGRGGSGSARLIPEVIEAARHLPPRIVIGFSDATAMINALAAKLGWLTFHGPAVTSLARTDLDHVRAVVCGQVRSTPIVEHALSQPQREPDPPTAPGPLEGRLFGGNLTVLTTLMGTPSQPPSAGTIWLLEDVNEPSYRIDRALRHLRDAGATHDAIGAWCGPLHADRDAPPTSINRAAQDLALPCLPGFPGGHTGRMHLVPLGAQVRLDPAAGALIGLHPWVRERTSGRRIHV